MYVSLALSDVDVGSIIIMSEEYQREIDQLKESRSLTLLTELLATGEACKAIF